MKLTKIIATLGPATEDLEVIKRLIEAGADIFRLNFKHNTPQWHRSMIKKIRRAAKLAGREVGVLLDLQGEEIRINLPVDYYELQKGDILHYSTQPDKKSGRSFFYFSHPEVVKFLKKGESVLIDDGKLRFYVDFIDSDPVLVSEQDGVLYDRKTVSLPESNFTFGRILERDLQGIKISVEEKVDFLAVSFIKTADDIKRVKEEVERFRGKIYPIAKIETRQAIENLEGIVEDSFSVMVARGDLAVETSMEEMPYLQKKIIRLCIGKTKPVITATQMLESMTENFFPTRAEISDAANAVYDFTDAVMLSNETAVGRYPVRTVEVMSQIISFNEKKYKQDIRDQMVFLLKDQEEMIVDTAYNLSLSFHKKHQDKVKGFMVFTHTGRTARLLSRYRSVFPIFAFSPFVSVVRSLTLSYGVYPFYFKEIGERKAVGDTQIRKAVERLKKEGCVSSSDKLIVLHGDIFAVEGGTSVVHIITV